MIKSPSILHYTPPGAPPAIAVSTVKPTAFPHGRASFDEISKFFDLENDYPELKLMASNRDKREFIAKKHAELIDKCKVEENDIEKKRLRLKWLRKQLKDSDGLTEWADAGLRIEKPDGPSFRDLRKAVASGQTMYFDKDIYAETPALDFEKEVFRYAEVMLIEHDWAAAFERANVENASIRLPYDVCAFEFKFSGRSVIALATQLGEDIAFTPAVKCGNVWALFGFVAPASGYYYQPQGVSIDGTVELMDVIAAQIRAACIALDAKVARSDVVREPHIGSGKNSYQPLKGYHVVSLARRGPRPLSSSSAETGRHVRLHFRRGHWRHFEDHRTWINWMLVGDPDLGFVEKHYKL